MKRTLLSKRRKLNGSGLPLPKPVFCITLENSSSDRLQRFMDEWCKNIRGLWPDPMRVKVYDATNTNYCSSSECWR